MNATAYAASRRQRQRGNGSAIRATQPNATNSATSATGSAGAPGSP